MTHIIEKNKCTGCNACFNICPANAISMLEDKEGFKFPIIDETKCTNCGLCSKICPVINTKYDNEENPKCFAFMANDEIRKNSASGGVFAHLAHTFINNGGYVVGAVYTGDWTVEHIVSNKLEDIAKMQSSKYLQSDTKSCYKEIKNILEEGKKVLFSGTPCQVAGLKSFLRKNYENLYSLDILCHGVPSPKVFKKYLDDVYGIKNIKTYNFRSKEKNDWIGCSKCELSTGEVILKDKKTDEFYIPFLNNLILRKCCGNCKFNKFPRQGDLSIGDFWGISNYKKKYDDKKGTSLVLLNNKKGDFLINSLKSNSKLLKAVPIKYALPYNPNLTNSSVLHKNRDLFFDNLDKMSFVDNNKSVIGNKADCLILNLWSCVNYGASLTCYGVQCLVEKLGYSPKIINYRPKIKLKYENSFAEKFANKYLHLTTYIKEYEDLIALNKDCNNFIVGSDQVWNDNLMHTHSSKMDPSVWLLDFVSAKNKKISYAASFGFEDLLFSQEILTKMKHYFPQFDSISVREDDGKRILKENFNINSEQLIDGAFHISQEKLNDLTKDFVVKEDYIACFTLPYYKKQSWYKSILPKIQEKYNLPIKHFDFEANLSIEEWLAFIKNAKCVITDSYHGTVFSIIFEKDFIQLKNAKTLSRFNSLYRLLEFENRSIGEKSKDIDIDKLLAPRDYIKTKKIIQKEVEKAELWIKNALEKEKEDNFTYEITNEVIQNQFFKNRSLQRTIDLLSQKDAIKKQYFISKILSRVSIGKTRKRYKELRKKLRPLYVELKNNSKFDVDKL